MKNTWFESRKEVFLRDLLRDFFEAKIYFDRLIAEHKKSSTIPFKMLDSWVGTETKKGPLWNLKDQSHRLFRNQESQANLFEYLFDWALGSIFHESMKLKEDSYQLEAYKPLLELETFYEHCKDNRTVAKLINKYVSLIEKTPKNLARELQNITQLFSEAQSHLREIFFLHRDNNLLVRFILDNKKSVEKVLGKGSFLSLLSQMFPEGIQMAYLAVGEDCMQRGWSRDAARYLKKAVKLGSENSEALNLLKKLQNTPHTKVAKETIQ